MKKRAKGGRTVEMNAKGSRAMEDAHDKGDDFKRGGSVKRAAGGRVSAHSPLSGAGKLSERVTSRRAGHEGE